MLFVRNTRDSRIYATIRTVLPVNLSCGNFRIPTMPASKSRFLTSTTSRCTPQKLVTLALAIDILVIASETSEKMSTDDGSCGTRSAGKSTRL
jgi:hypothetical protein